MKGFLFFFREMPMGCGGMVHYECTGTAPGINKIKKASMNGKPFNSWPGDFGFFPESLHKKRPPETGSLQ